MPVPPESVQIGRCYRTKKGQIRRVIDAVEGKVAYHARQQVALEKGWPRREVTTKETFAANALEEVPCPPELEVPTRGG